MDYDEKKNLSRALTQILRYEVNGAWLTVQQLYDLLRLATRSTDKILAVIQEDMRKQPHELHFKSRTRAGTDVTEFQAHPPKRNRGLRVGEGFVP